MNGIILIFYGIIAIIETNILKEMVTILLGGYLIFKSSSRFQLAINIKNDHSKTWIWLLILAIISLIIGFLMILNPLPSLMKINAFIAWLLIISEIINIIENIIILIGIRKNEKENK